MTNREIFMKVHAKMKTLGFAISLLKIREFNSLKACMKKKKKCLADVMIFREAKRCINVCNLEYLKVHWEPSEHMQWFVDNGICSRKRPNKKFQLLYEWVEDEVDESGFILATEVREQADVLLGDGFGKYKKFERLGERLRKFFNLKAVKVNGSGRRVKWVSKV